MSEFEDKLNAILSNSEAMSQVMQLAQSLNLGGSSPEENGGSSENTASASPPPQASPQQSAGGGMDFGGIGDLLGQIDPKMIQRLLPLMGELTGDGGGDQRLQLLYALRPFLKPERRDKIDRALKAAKLLHVGKKFLMTMGDSNV